MSNLNISSQNFDQEVLKSEGPVLVDFWAPWCGPCQMQAPIIEELAEEHKDKKIKIVKINIDENQEVAGKYKVLSIPSLIIFNAGKEEDRMQGFQAKELLAEKIGKYL